MFRFLRIGAVTAVLAAGFVLGAAQPASAAFTASSAGTVVTVNVTGNESIHFDCPLGAVRVNGSAVAPAVACSALTKVVINGDGGEQNVWGADLGTNLFTAHPYIQASLAGGADWVVDTFWADIIDLGAGDGDSLIIQSGSVSNTSQSVGSGAFDNVSVEGNPENDTITASSTGATATVAITGSVSATQVIGGAENLYILAGAGNDTVNANGVTGASTIGYLSLNGNSGANTLTSINHETSFYDEGGSAVMTGGPGTDTFWTSSPSDVVHTGSGNEDPIFDYESLRSGGRTLDAPGAGVYYSYIYGNDAVARVRAGAGAGTARVTASLNRPGIAELPVGVSAAGLIFGSVGARPSRNLADIVSLGKNVNASGDFSDDDVADVTITSGGYSTIGSLPAGLTIQTNDPSLGDIHLEHFGSYHLHGPWTNPNEGFAHRVTRDLLFRFLNTAQRQAIRDQLAAGVTTRAAVADGIVFGDEYRGLDVDRVFRRFLKREADASGRTYWINRIREGRSLRKFRAQLFGSNEYFTKAGGTNEGFVVAAYTDVLGRAPDDAGKTFWVNRLNSGVNDRGSVANAFLASSEARRFLVRDQFLRFLDRYPTDAELDTWMPVILDDAQGEQHLIISLAASSAYYART